MGELHSIAPNSYHIYALAPVLYFPISEINKLKLMYIQICIQRFKYILTMGSHTLASKSTSFWYVKLDSSIILNTISISELLAQDQDSWVGKLQRQATLGLVSTWMGDSAVESCFNGKEWNQTGGGLELTNFFCYSSFFLCLFAHPHTTA